MSIEVLRTKRGERRYKVRLRDPAGREYARRFRTRREAETFEFTERADQARGLWVDRRRKNVCVAQWASDWLDANPAADPIERIRDRFIVENHINPSIGHLKLSEVMPRDISLLVSDWRTTLGRAYARLPYAVLSAIFDKAVEAELIEYSPCE